MIYHSPIFRHVASGGLTISGEVEIKARKVHRHPPHIREKVIELSNQGVKQHQIAKQLGLSYPTVSTWLSELGISSSYKFVELRDKIQAANAAGKTNPEIAELFGIPRLSVIRYLNRFGIKSVPCSRKYTPEVIERIRELAEQGLSQREIADEIGGTHQSFISKVMTAHGIKPGVRKLKPVKTWASVSVTIE